jgi:hypothetical protein
MVNNYCGGANHSTSRATAENVAGSAQPSSAQNPTVETELARIHRLVGPCPREGNGVHTWIFLAALRLKNRCDSKTASIVISRAVSKCGRLVPPREIEDAIRNATGSFRGPRQRRWPEKNRELIVKAVVGMPSLAALRQLSPINPDALTAEQIVETLFPGDETLLCVGTDKTLATTRNQSDLRGGLGKKQFIVPNAMIGIAGTNLLGRRSRRCLDNTGPRQYLVVESDPEKWASLTEAERAKYSGEVAYIAAKKDEAARVLWHLAQIAKSIPLVMVVDSGGKSIHGWFRVAGVPEERVRRFFRYAVALGADRATWTPCQFVRMPNGTRDNGKKQCVIYLNPEAKEVQ